MKNLHVRRITDMTKMTGSAYLGGKTFDENGDEEVEEDVVSESHQRDEVQRGPRRRPRHSVV